MELEFTMRLVGKVIYIKSLSMICSPTGGKKINCSHVFAELMLLPD